MIERLARATAILCVASAACTSTATAQGHQHVATSVQRLGNVHFRTSCSPAAQPKFDHAMALLHSFEFARAIEAFNVVLASDPTCAMAEWGIALSDWTNPMTANAKPAVLMLKGRAAVQRAVALGPKTERERDYIEAVSKLYTTFETAPQPARVVAYRDAMATVAAKYPDDTEASIFYAIALTAAASPADKSYADQLKAGAILEAQFANEPNHPGLAHYIIHTYDVPPLAGRAVAAAGRYSKIAPSAPHALHMPSHTFTRIGAWQSSIDANIASAKSAKLDSSTAEELHASDYMTYAYLQTGQDAAARRVLQALPEIETRFDPAAIGGAASGSAGIFALAAIPARIALERSDWAAAVALQPRSTPFSHADAITWFARAIGGARSGDTTTARAAVEALERIQAKLAASGEVYWTEQVRIQALGARAWLAYAGGQPVEALTLMREAANAEDRTEKNAVTPGPLAPAREMLGEMLLLTSQARPALVEFEATLRKEPNRFRALDGAARAAATAGDIATAQRYDRQLVTMCARGDKPGRAELVAARQADRHATRHSTRHSTRHATRHAAPR